MPLKATTYKKVITHFILIGIFLCTLFGSGLHLHSVFSHLFDYGSLYAYVHAHPDEANLSHNPEFDDEKTHQHPTAKVDLTGTLTQKTTNKASANTEFFSDPAVSGSQKTLQSPGLLYLDLPPPVHLFQSSHFTIFSLRGPPMG